MSRTRKIIIIIPALLCLACLWVWWNRPEKVDMAAYAPADTLIYMEADSLPEIVRSVISTNAWREMAPAAGIDSGSGKFGWLSQFAEWTGIGSNESVLFTRSQVAVCILGFSAAESSETALKISPRGAVIVETHAGEGRVRAAVEKTVGDYARRSLGSGEAKRDDNGRAVLYTWVAPDDTRKRIVAAVMGTLAVIGNDEAAVRACLAARMGERPTLADDPQLKEMRARVGGEGALAFGYAPSGSAAKIVEATIPLFAGQASDEPQVQRILVSLLPKLAHRTIGSAAWGTHFEDGSIVDNYLLLLPDGVTSRLSDAAIGSDAPMSGADELLPADTFQISSYNYRDPEAAWLSLNAGLSTRVDAIHAPVVTLALEALLKPYGVESPREFLRATQSEILTARLKEASDSKVLIVRVRNREELLRQVRKHLGEGVQLIKSGDDELMVSADAGQGAASLVSDFLILGTEEDVRSCLSARAEKRTLASTERLKTAAASSSDRQAHVMTVTSDEEAARSFVLNFARRRKGVTFDEGGFRLALGRLPYSVSETRITHDGIEKRTRSSFGQLGVIVARFAPRNNTDTPPAGP